MATVAEVEARYTADTTRYVRQVQQAVDATNRFAASIPQAEQAQSSLKASTVALGAAMGTLGAMAFAKAAGAIQKYAMQGIQAAAQYEQTVISMEGIFQGSGLSMQEAASKTERFLGELRDFAARTPFELPQTLDAVKRLLSIGYAAEDVKDRLLPAIGDIAAALGQPASSISGVVYAFGQMKSAGRVLGQDLMQIGNALPGFNAKMALVNEMFGGDAVAAQKAFESGAVDSATAIDVLIKAMTEFPGAAGAMERQSRSLLGVISTFKDTINNALIDGLMPAIPTLSGALETLVGPVSDLATAFAQSLGPTLVSLVQGFSEVAPVVSAVLPPLISLIGQATILSDLIVALSPVIIAMGNAAGLLAQGLSAVPAPILATVAAVLLLRKALASQGPIMSGVRSAGDGLRGTLMSLGSTWQYVGVQAKAAGVANLTAGQQLRATAAAVVTTGQAMNGMKAAMSGVMGALGGPWGIAIAAASAGLMAFLQHQQDAKARTDEFYASLDAVTGKLTEAGSAALMSTLLGEIDSTDWAVLNEFGLGIDEATKAITGGEKAMWDYIDRLNDLQHVSALADVNTQAVNNNIYDQGVAYQEATRRVETAAQAQRDMAAANTYAAHSALEAGTASYYAAHANDKAADSVNTNAAALARQAIHADDATYATKVTTYQTNFLTEAQKRLTGAVNGANRAVNNIFNALSRFRGADAAKRSIIDLSKQLEDVDKKAKKANPGRYMQEKALNDKAAVYDAVDAWVQYAMQTKNTDKQQKRLAAGQKAINAELGKQGTSLKKLGIGDLNTLFDKAQKKTGLLADKWAEEQERAKAAGLTLGDQWIASIAYAIENGQSVISLASQRALAGLGVPPSTSLYPISPLTPAQRSPYPTSPISPTQADRNPQNVTTINNWNFGGITAETPADAARQARLAAKLRQLDPSVIGP